MDFADFDMSSYEEAHARSLLKLALTNMLAVQEAMGKRDSKSKGSGGGIGSPSAAAALVNEEAGSGGGRSGGSGTAVIGWRPSQLKPTFDVHRAFPVLRPDLGPRRPAAVI